jgi:hypothetical protein
MPILSFFASLLGFGSKIWGWIVDPARRAKKEGMEMQAAVDRAANAEAKAEAYQEAAALETEMREAQAAIAADVPPPEQPHAGTDLFRP